MHYRRVLDAFYADAAKPKPHRHLLAVGTTQEEDAERSTDAVTVTNVCQDGEVCRFGPANGGQLVVIRKAYCQLCFEPVLRITPPPIEPQLPEGTLGP